MSEYMKGWKRVEEVEIPRFKRKDLQKMCLLENLFLQ